MSSVNLQRNKDFIISQLGDDFIDADNFEMRYQCPFCQDLGLKYEDYKFYITYAPKKKSDGKWVKAGTYWCHRCESKGVLHIDGLISQGSNSEGVDYLESYMKLLDGEDLNSKTEEESDYYLIPPTIPMPGTLAWDYLISRGITPADMSFYGIRVPNIYSERKFFGRIIIPSRIISSNWTDMYVARTYIDDPIRYKNPSSSKAHDLVFNLHRIPDNPKRIIINEGAINSIIAGYDSVATFGKHVSDLQLNLILQKKPESIYVSLDTDARDKAEKLCDRIISLSDAKVMFVELPEGKDASDLGRNNYLEILNNARQYTNKAVYFIEQMIESLGSG